MTNPAWVVLFTKIAGLVTDAGGTTSHPAVLSREFGIPAVVGTSVATHRISTGDRFRVDGIDRAWSRSCRAEPADPAGPPRLPPIGRLSGSPMATARIVPRSVLADQVKDRLLEGILSGAYPPDSRIVETQVARELGTSQAPVREALRALEALGVVEITPFRGARVRRPSRRELLEAYGVRADARVAWRAAGRPAADRRPTSTSWPGYVRGDAARRRAPATATGTPRPTRASTGGSSSSPTTARSSGSGARSSRSRGPTSRLVVPGADPQWSADLHAPILEAHRSAATPRRSSRARAALRGGPRQHGRPLAGRGRRAMATGAEPAARPRNRMNATPATVRGDVGGPARLRVDVHRRRAARARARRHELPQLPARRRPDLAEVSVPSPDIVWHQDGDKAIAYDGRTDDLQRRRGRPGRSRRSSSRCSRSGWRRSGSTRSMPRPCATATRRSCSSAASRTTASPWARSRPAGAARCSSRPRRRSSTRRAGGHGLEGAVPQEAHRGHRAGRQGRAGARRREVLRRDADLGDLHRAEHVDVVIVPAIDGNFDAVVAPR